MVHVIDDYRLILPEVDGKGVRVAVIDSGWQRLRNDPRVIPGVAILQDSRTSKDDADRLGHGTACINTLLAIAPACEVVPIRVFESTLETAPTELIRAIDWAVNSGSHVINLSLGTTRDDAVRPLFATCEAAVRAGVIIVAAARLSHGGWSYPAVFEPVISVGSGGLTSMYSIEYSPTDAIECRLETRGRLVTALDKQVIRANGTSFVAPIVTGIIVKWMQIDRSLTVSRIRSQFRSFRAGASSA